MQGRKIVVMGAGMVGLSVAWHARQRGADVVVLEGREPAAGSSWGNAGWVSPALAVPLAEPAVLQVGLRSLIDRNSPLYLAPRLDATLIRFGLRFLRDCTLDRWRRTMARSLPLNQQALAAFDRLTPHLDPSRAATPQAPIWAAFRTEADMAGLRREIELIIAAGLTLDTTEVSPQILREQLPFLTDEITAGIRIDGQRHLNGGEYVTALADALVRAGGQIMVGSPVREVRRDRDRVICELPDTSRIEADDVVLATGAWLPRLARQHGVRVPLVAGRGYSFRVDVPQGSSPQCCYLPTQRVACTPVDGRLRIAGTMEFRPVDAPFDQGRVEAIIRSIKPLVQGIDFDSRTDEWVGARPVTADSLPLIGSTSTRGVWVAGGHGMWGITFGPVTGELLVEQMATGRPHPALAAFDPSR